MRPPLKAPAEPPKGQTFLYVIQSIQFCKIGHAANLYIRLSNIRVDNPHDPILIQYWSVPIDLAKRIEDAAQSEVWEHRAAGDWFKITPELAVTTVERISAAIIHFDADSKRRRAEMDAKLD